MAIHVVLARLDVDHFGRSVLVGVVLVVHPLGNVDRDAPNGVHHVDESLQVDERVVVDRDVHQLLERCHDQRRSRIGCVGIELRMLLSELIDRVGNVGEAVALVDVQTRRQWHLREVAWHLQDRRIPCFGIDAHHHHRIGAYPGPPHSGVTAEQQNVQPPQACPEGDGRRGRRRRSRRAGRRSHIAPCDRRRRFTRLRARHSRRRRLEHGADRSMRNHVRVRQIRVGSNQEHCCKDDEQPGGFRPKRASRNPGSETVRIDRSDHPQRTEHDVANEDADENVGLNKRLQQRRQSCGGKNPGSDHQRECEREHRPTPPPAPRVELPETGKDRRPKRRNGSSGSATVARNLHDVGGYRSPCGPAERYMARISGGAPCTAFSISTHLSRN